MQIDSHLGGRFEIWNGRHTWFWFVSDAASGCAAIGAAATEAEALGEAGRSIEQMAARDPRAADPHRTTKAIVCRSRRGGRPGLTESGWSDVPVNLERPLLRQHSQRITGNGSCQG
jgi:hypothetical protein